MGSILRYPLALSLATLIVVGIGYSYGSSSFSASTKAANVAATCGYDECYEDPWYVFPEDQYEPAPSPEYWNWSDERAVTVIDDVEPAWLFDGPYDQWGTPIEYYGELDPWGYEVYEIYEQPKQQDPWYVSSFPGFGKLAQQLIPGQITVTQPVQQAAPRPVYAQPSCWVSAQPTEVSSNGSSVLSWSAFNASSASIEGIGSVPTSGSRTITGITGQRNYTMRVSGQGGSGSCYTQINVRQAVAQPSCIISVNPNVIYRGESANVAWGSQNASSANLSGYGSVSVYGGLSVHPAQSTSYTLTVYGQNGVSKSCTSRLNVY